MKTGELIKKLRTEKGLTQEQLGDLVGVQKSAIAKWENGRVENIKRPKIKLLAEIFGVSPTIFLNTDDVKPVKGQPILPESVMPLPDLSALNRIPILGTIACGSPITANQEYEYLEVDEMIKADFCVRAKGDSMIDAGVRSGSIVLCRYAEQVENGQIAAVSIADDVTLKKFYSYGDTIVLRPCNPDFHEQVYSRDELNEIRIIGKAVTCISSIN